MLNEKASLDIVKTMLCSVIDYGNMFINTCNTQDLADLQVLQNNALRCCYNVTDPRDEHIFDLHVKANMKLLDVRRKKQLILCIWRNVQSGFVELHIPTRVTRAGTGCNIRLPIPRTEQYKRSVYYMGSQLWNCLNEETRNSNGLLEFKKAIEMIY